MAIQLRRGIASDIVPAEILQGELVYYTDTGRLAIGNGNGGLNVIQTQLSPIADQQVQFKGYVTDLDGLYVGGAYKTQKGTGTPVTYPPGTTDYNGWVEVLRYLPSGYPTGIIVQRRTDTAGQTWVRISTQAQPTTAAHWSTWTAAVADGSITLPKLAPALQNTLSNSLKYTRLAGDANIDNLYGSANYGAYYPPHISAAGTYPPGESALTGILFVFDSGGSWAGQVWIGKKCYYRLNHSTSEAAWDAWSTYDIPDGSITEQKLADDVLESIDNKIDMHNLTTLEDIESASIPSGLYRMTLTTTGTKPTGETSLSTTLLFVVQTNSTSGYQIWLGKKCYSRSKAGVMPWTAWSDYTVDDGTITMAKLAADLQNLINGKADTANTYTQQQSDNRFANAVIASKSGNPATLSDVQAGTQFKAVTVRGVTTESGTGDKSPDNPYALSGISNPTVTVNGTDYPTTTSTLYSLPNGVEDTLDLVSGVETHRVGVKVFDGTETWSNIPAQANDTTLLFGLTLSPDAASQTSYPNSRVCSHFAAGDIYGAASTVEGFFNASGATLYIRVLKSRLSTPDTAGFKAWLATLSSSETPVTLLYQLATPTTIQRTAQTIPASSPNSTVTASAGNLTVQYNQDIAGALALKANKAQEDWITPTLVNGWVSDASYPVKYMIDQFGFVHMRGCVSGGAAGTIVFTLPTGYRSSIRQYFLCGKIDGGGATTGARITMFSSGALYAEVASTSIDLSAVYFKAD